MKKLYLFMAGIVLACLTYGQTTITQWNFNSSTLTPSISSSSSDALMLVYPNSLIPALTGSYVSAAGSSDPGGTNMGYYVTNFPGAGQNDASSGIQFDVSTAGYGNIQISFDYKNDASAANTFSIQYSINGSSYTQYSTITTASTAFNNSITVNLSSITGLNNNTNVSFRILTTFDGTTGDYKATNGASSYITTAGVIFDMVTVKGTALTCSGSPTTQAGNVHIFSTTASTMKLSFDRGNGGGAIVVIKQGSPVDGYPSSGTSYTADSTFGNGAQIGTGNYVVYNSTEPGTHVFTVKGLTSGKKYYIAVFEYSSGGNCYLNPPITSYATTSGTNLMPGDMVIVGFDAIVNNSGTFKMCLMPLVDLKAGSSFSVVFSRFEAGAAANTRTNKWYYHTYPIYSDIPKFHFTVNAGFNITAGSIISFTSVGGSDPSSVLVNGSSYAGLLGTNENGAAIQTGAPTQMYIVQGDFLSHGTTGTNRYSTLSGRVIYGLSNQVNWTPFTSAVSTGTVASQRTSRLPQEINCINNYFTTSNTRVAYYTGATTSGTKRQVLAAITNNANWTTTTSSSTTDEVPAISSFTISGSSPDGTWFGDANTNWFDCSNWGGYYVSEASTDVTVGSSTVNNPAIDVSAANANFYSNKAEANNLTINTGKTVSLNGAGADKLYLWGDLTINNASGKLSFTGTSTSDTLFMYGNWNASASGNAAGINFDPGNGTVAFYCNNDTQAISEAGSNTFYKLYMNNKYGLNVGTGGTKKVSNEINLNNGVITIAPGTTFTLANTSSIKSPANNYGNTNEGYESSYLNGAASIEINSSSNKVLPIGGGGYFAPIKIQKFNTNLTTYTGQYFAVPYVDTINVDVTLHHVSKKEYWILTSNTTGTDDDAYITLSWRPFSKVTNVTNYSDSIVVAHYHNPGTGLMWYPEFNNLAANITSGNANYGTVTSNKYVTTYSPFTLGSLTKNIILPFKLIYWNAALNSGTVDLNWQIENDYEIGRYEIQRSTDGVLFNVISTSGSLNKFARWNYTGADLNPVEGWNYYRLKIISSKGEVTYSQVVKVKIGDPGNIIVYPNPTISEIYLKIGNLRSVSTIELVSLNGQVIRSIIPSEPLTKLNVEFLSKGTYYFRIKTADGVVTQKFIKQ